MKVVLSPRAEKQLRKITKIAQIAIAKKIRNISVAEKISGEEKLTGDLKIFSGSELEIIELSIAVRLLNFISS